MLEIAFYLESQQVSKTSQSLCNRSSCSTVRTRNKTSFHPYGHSEQSGKFLDYKKPLLLLTHFSSSLPQTNLRASFKYRYDLTSYRWPISSLPATPTSSPSHTLHPFSKANISAIHHTTQPIQSSFTHHNALHNIHHPPHPRSGGSR